TAFREQFEPPLEGRQQLDAVSEHEARVGPERHDRDWGSFALRSFENAPVTQMHSVEASDRDDASRGREFLRSVSDLHSRARASSGEMNRSGSASSTVKGPISIRRSVRQCPPSTSAIART